MSKNSTTKEIKMKKDDKKKVAAKPMTAKGNYSSKTSEPMNDDAKMKKAVKKKK